MLALLLCANGIYQTSAKTAVFIVGTGRSGTSCVAGAMEIMGVELGQNLKPANIHNKEGYFENKEVNKLNNKLVKRLPAAWWNVERIEWDTISDFDELKDQVKTCLQNEFSSYEIFGVKDPKVSTLLPLYCTAAQKLGYTPKVIVELRNPTKIVSSFKSRREKSGKNPETIVSQIQYWISMCTMSLLEHACTYDTCVVHFEDILADAKKVADTLKLFIPELSSYEEVEDQLNHFLQKDLVTQKEIVVPVVP